MSLAHGLDGTDSSATASTREQRHAEHAEPVRGGSDLGDVESGAQPSRQLIRQASLSPGRHENDPLHASPPSRPGLQRWKSVDPAMLQSTQRGTDDSLNWEHDEGYSTPEIVSRPTDTYEQAEHERTAHTRRAGENEAAHGLYSEVKVDPSTGEIWQLKPPHLLLYSPANLHNFGWVVLNQRLVTATVLTNAGLWLKGILLAGWTLTIHQTGGLGVEQKDQHDFVAVFGTTYMGSVRADHAMPAHLAARYRCWLFA